ncbi:MAG TPA: acyltransferase [Caulobacteraceae bacterium]|nr:acyltransferase [Caulobacteraceae bacterium]
MHTYVPGLDGIRAICITLVVLGHLGFGGIFPGGLGVTTFFFISGYLITRLLAAEHDRFGRLDLPRFYGRRLLRLAPELVTFVAVLGLVIAPALGQPLPIGAALAALFYWTNYYLILGFDTCQDCSITGHLWSLAVEEHFYLVMPLVMAACAFAPKRLQALLVGVGVACLGWRFYAHSALHLPEVYTYKSTECRVDSIGWGCLAAMIERSQSQVMALMKRRGAAIFGAGAGLMLASLLIRDETFRETARYSLQGLALFAMVLPMTVAPKLAWINAVLEHPVLRWMGRRSYGAYLWHYAALTFTALALGVTGQLETASLPDRLTAIPMVLAGTWVLAAVSYVLVFKPSQRLKPWLEAGPAAPRPLASPLNPGSAAS